jgi:hypothetical protein
MSVIHIKRLDDLEKKYSTPLEKPLLTNFLNNTTSWCRLNPIGCTRQALIETLFLIVTYSAVIFLVGGIVPSVGSLLKFALVFLLMNIAARMVSDSFSDKLAIAALSGLALKCTSLLVPQLSSW